MFKHEALTGIAVDLPPEDLEVGRPDLGRRASTDPSLPVKGVKEVLMPFLSRRTHRGILIAILCISVIGGTATSASGMTPKAWYWSESRAATLVKLNVKIPCAKLKPNPSHLPPAAICATQPPSSLAGATVTCAGQGTPLKGTRRYTRFVCRWSTVNQTSYGSLLVYVSGVSTFRWKVI